jgi:predicted DNA-binding protein (UPF0251 family)
VFAATLPLPTLPASAESSERLPLVEIIELKWLLAGHGVHIHVERLQRDPVYAREKLAAAIASGQPALCSAAHRLLARLAPLG